MILQWRNLYDPLCIACIGGFSIVAKKYCEIAFKKTNTIEEVWWENEGVTYVGPEKTCRSTSTGDYVLIGTRKYKCAFVGWELV